MADMYLLGFLALRPYSLYEEYLQDGLARDPHAVGYRQQERQPAAECSRAC